RTHDRSNVSSMSSLPWQSGSRVSGAATGRMSHGSLTNAFKADQKRHLVADHAFESADAPFATIDRRAAGEPDALLALRFHLTQVSQRQRDLPGLAVHGEVAGEGVLVAVDLDLGGPELDLRVLPGIEEVRA